MTRQEFADWHEDPREQELRERDLDEWCGQCAGADESCPACGTEDPPIGGLDRLFG